MKSKTVTVVAILKAKPGKQAALKKELLKLIPPTLKEPGCINYDLHQDIEDPTRFVFHEKWKDRAHLEAHLCRPHLQAFDAKADKLLSEPVELILGERIG